MFGKWGYTLREFGDSEKLRMATEIITSASVYTNII